MQKEIVEAKGMLYAGVRLYVSITSDEVSDTMQVTVEAANDKEFAFTVPMKDGNFLPLAKDTPIGAFFYGGSGKYLFKTVVKGRILLEDKPVIVCDLPQSLIRTERREYYRVDTILPVRLHIDKANDNAAAEKSVYETYYVDISGGGMQIDPITSVKIPLKRNDKVELDLCEAFGVKSRVQGVIVRAPIKDKTGWGIQFTKISYYDRDKIIRYVFKKQLEMKNR